MAAVNIMTQATCYFFGTFNPVHIGHLLMASQAVALAGESLSFGSVTFVPAASPPHRQGEAAMLSALDRYHLIEKALYGYPHLKISRVELDMAANKEHNTPIYTADALKVLAQASGGQSQTKYVMLMGQDSFQSLPGWRDLEWLLAHCRFLVLNRPASSPKPPELPGKLAEKLDWHSLAAPQMMVSATHIRQLCQDAVSLCQETNAPLDLDKLRTALSVLIPGKALDYFMQNALPIYVCR